MIKSISAAKKHLTQSHPSKNYPNNCQRSEAMRQSFKFWNECTDIKLSSDQTRAVSIWIDSIMML